MVEAVSDCNSKGHMEKILMSDSTTDDDDDDDDEYLPSLTMNRAKSKKWFKLQLIFASTFFCFINMVFMEQLLRILPNSANFIALVQHVTTITICLIKLRGLPFGLLNSPPPVIAVHHYFPLVLLNLGSILSNSASLNQGIPIPLNMIFKSSSLIANLFLGVLFLHHRPPPGKYCAAVVITLGLILCTYEDYRVRRAVEEQAEVVMAEKMDTPGHATGSQPLGIAFLSLSLLLSAGIGIYQESLVRRFGKYSDEALLYVHLLSLPLFCLVAFSDLLHHWTIFTACLFDPCSPTLPNYLTLILLLCTVASQFGCISCVYRLATECTSFTVSLVVTNRKFLSLMFSIYYFGNVFTVKHYLGSGMVFAGTLAISFIWS